MIQEIITYMILALAFGSFLFKIFQFFGMSSKKKQNLSECMGCSGNCRKKEIFPTKRYPTKNYGQIRLNL